MNDLNATTGFPLDFCEWVAPASLQRWVQEELKNVTDPAAQGGRKTLLGVLAFAYARGIFDSEEILGLCRSDPLFKALHGTGEFSWEDMLDARHKDRTPLINFMMRVLTRAVAEKHGVPAASLDPALKRRLHENVVDRLDNARNMDRGEEE